MARRWGRGQPESAAVVGQRKRQLPGALPAPEGIGSGSRGQPRRGREHSRKGETRGFTLKATEGVISGGSGWRTQLLEHTAEGWQQAGGLRRDAKKAPLVGSGAGYGDWGGRGYLGYSTKPTQIGRA